MGRIRLPAVSGDAHFLRNSIVSTGPRVLFDMTCDIEPKNGSCARRNSTTHWAACTCALVFNGIQCDNDMSGSLVFGPLPEESYGEG